jgi:predicted MFS family arabinose efflux permease
VHRTAERATFRDVFAVSEFRALWLAQVLSVAGDQLARVALTWLVFERTRSSLLAALTFVVSIVPTFVGGLTLSGLADRHPRRRVMIFCDIIRAVLVAIMAIPGMPLAVLVGLLFLVTMAGAPFTSARAALYPDLLPGDGYVVGTAVTLTTYQVAQVIGFAVGGSVVSLFGTRTSLLADAATFAASALVVRFGVRAWPAARKAVGSLRLSIADVLGGVRVVFADGALRAPMLFGWMMAFYDAPEGVAAPFASTLGGGAATLGMVLAAGALGASLGAVAFVRLVGPARRQRWMRPLAVACCADLMLIAFRPGLLASLLILTVCGLLSAYQVAANAAFVTAAPQPHRGQAFGLATAGMSLCQGTAMILAGAAAERLAPAVVIALTGASGTIAAATLAISTSGRRN